MNKYLSYLQNSLELLKKRCPEVEIKAEFESEGAMLIDASFLNSQCKKFNIPFNVKVGGVEALRDIYELCYINVDGLIAPIVESKFAVQKFKDSLEKVSNISNLKKKAVLIESTQGMLNILEIVSEFGFEVNTLIIGRSDLLASYQKDKGSHRDINSSEFLNYIFDSLETIKSQDVFKDIKIGLGGKLSLDTLKIIGSNKRFVKILDFVETRKVVLPLISLLKNNDILSLAIDFERNYIAYKMNYMNNLLKKETSRILLLESRLSTEE